jgi:hypothetical protein
MVIMSKISISTVELLLDSFDEFFHRIFNSNTLRTFKFVSNIQKIFDAALNISSITENMLSERVRLNSCRTILIFFHDISSTNYM